MKNKKLQILKDKLIDIIASDGPDQTITSGIILGSKIDTFFDEIEEYLKNEKFG